MKYRPEIDGLRTLAVLPVILYHLVPKLFPAGFVGVDIFFVISGFLITSIVLKEKKAGSFSIKNFWIRRIKRLFPAMATVLTATLLAGSLLLFPSELAQLGRQALAVLYMGANIHMYKESGYWQPEAEDIALLHTWSLGVEEQFYLVYVLGLLCLLKYQSKHVKKIIGLVMLLSFSLCIYSSEHHPDANFYLLHTRAWELLAGAFVAFYLQGRSLVKNRKMIYGSGLLLLLSYVWITPEQAFPGWITLLPVLGTAGFTLFSTAGCDTWLEKILKNKLIVYIGKISYGLYLWHWPIIVFYRRVIYPEDLGFADCLMIVFLTFVFSVCSYVFIENPIRKSNKTYMPKAILASLVLLCFIGQGMRKEWIRGFNEPTYVLGEKAPGKYNIKKSWREGPLVVGEGTPEIVLIGDSHAKMYAPVVEEIARELGLTVAFFTMNAVSSPFVSDEIVSDSGLSYKDLLEYDEVKRKNLKNSKPKLVISIDRYQISYPKNRKDIYQSYFTELLSYTDKVVTVGQAPLAGAKENFIKQCNLRASKGLDVRLQEDLEVGVERRKANQQLNEICDALGTKAYFVAVEDLFLEDGFTKFANEDKITYYKDSDHLNNTGVALVKQRLQATIEKALKVK